MAPFYTRGSISSWYTNLDNRTVSPSYQSFPIAYQDTHSSRRKPPTTRDYPYTLSTSKKRKLPDHPGDSDTSIAPSTSDLTISKPKHPLNAFDLPDATPELDSSPVYQPFTTLVAEHSHPPVDVPSRTASPELTPSYLGPRSASHFPPVEDLSNSRLSLSSFPERDIISSSSLLPPEDLNVQTTSYSPVGKPVTAEVIPYALSNSICPNCSREIAINETPDQTAPVRMKLFDDDQCGNEEIDMALLFSCSLENLSGKCLDITPFATPKQY